MLCRRTGSHLRCHLRNSSAAHSRCAAQPLAQKDIVPSAKNDSLVRPYCRGVTREVSHLTQKKDIGEGISTAIIDVRYSSSQAQSVDGSNEASEPDGPLAKYVQRVEEGLIKVDV